MRVLLAEDDPLVGEAVRVALRHEGYNVDWTRDGDEAALAAELHEYGLVVLDLGLPGRDGLSVLRELRRRRQTVPVLILTARDDLASRVDGLDAGADDYLVKPFDIAELLARLRALRRRSVGEAGPMLQVGDIEIEPAARAVRVGGTPVDLSPREYALLLNLAEHAGRVRTRSQLESALYGWNDELGSNAIEVHIHHLRRKIGRAHVQTVRGVGYTMPRSGAE